MSDSRGHAPPTIRALGVIADPLSAVGYVRFVQPFSHLTEEGFELRRLGPSLSLQRTAAGWEANPALLDDVQLVIFPQSVASPGLPGGGRARIVEPVCREARRRGIPIVHSLDDGLQQIDPTNPAYAAVKDSSENFELLLAEADAFIVTTDELARSLEGRGKPIHVIPNAVDPTVWGRRPASSAGLTLGWAGSGSHLDDLALVVPAIRRLQSRVPFRFVLAGLTQVSFAEEKARIRRERSRFTKLQRDTARRFLALTKELEALDYEHVPFCGVQDFFRLLPALDLDLGLCPLVDSPFNRQKSALKFYEYAVTGSTTVASRVKPYVDEVSLTAPNSEAGWEEILEPLLRDPKLRRRELERQREFVLANRSIAQVKHCWSRSLREIVAPAVERSVAQ